MGDVSIHTRVVSAAIRLVAWTLPAIALHASPIYPAEHKIEVAQTDIAIVFLDPDSFPKAPSKSAFESPKPSNRKSYFTIECRENFEEIEGVGGPRHRFSATRKYTINTKQRVWKEPGGELKKLRVEGDELVLADHGSASKKRYHEVLNRTTGKYLLYSNHRNVVLIGYGTCDKVDLVPFTFNKL
ncbi:hypothetical protein RHSP_31437 [Rhizobium freirei PRF 81]|uniref:Uncharacterized protein n=1 Tax=Rhizobium freirei PRF 81 TaxID=363754 RepID=N6UYT0_9HYPH|nr:hypothetical protein [Rhizobium freirei]ENN86830.1 hypothetical protein RHSP_31437 [Rhizobium freirei PRF 81]